MGVLQPGNGLPIGDDGRPVYPSDIERDEPVLAVIPGDTIVEGGTSSWNPQQDTHTWMWAVERPGTPGLYEVMSQLPAAIEAETERRHAAKNQSSAS